MEGPRKLLPILASALTTAIACILFLYFSIPTSDTHQHHFDVILVLGNPANDDGSIANVARSRVLEGIREYRAGAAPRLLLSGGSVKNRFPEGEVMRQFALSQGVSADALIAETQSRNTLQNAFYS